MKVKPDIGQILSKAAVLLDSLVTPHPAAVDSEQTNQSSLAQLGHEEEEQVIQSNRRLSVGNEEMASLLSENVNPFQAGDSSEKGLN